MRVMVIVKANRSSEAGEMPGTELLAAMGSYNAELVTAGIILAGEGLRPTAHGVLVRTRDGTQTVLPGPFHPAEEQISGYWLWQVKSLDDAIAWAKRIPNPQGADTEFEIRPVFEAEDFGEAFTPELREQEAQLRVQSEQRSRAAGS